MLNGIFLATSGLLADETWQQVLANDLAQSNTPGYKSESAVIGSFGQILLHDTASGSNIGPISRGASVYETVPDMSQGSVLQTGNPMNVALLGPGFLAVKTPTGVAYTRDGGLALDAQGQLVNSLGQAVLGTNLQPIVAGPGASIASDGTVTVGGQVKGQIGLFDPLVGQLTNVGQNQFQASGTVPPDTTTRLVSGALEASNVDPASTLSAMIQVLRHFQAGQNFINQDTKTLDSFIQVAG